MMVSVGFAPACVGTKLPMAMLAATDTMKQEIADPRSRITFFIFERRRTFLSGRDHIWAYYLKARPFARGALASCDGKQPVGTFAQDEHAWSEMLTSKRM
jgi:hypothetical protein